MAAHCEHGHRGHDEPAYPDDRYAWCVFAILVAAVLLAYIDRQIVALLVEPLRHEFRLSDLQIGLLQGPAFALIYAVATIPVGWAVDRGHRRNLLLAGLLLWSVATAACAFAANFSWLLAARICVGIGEAVLIPGVFSLLGDYFKPARKPLVFGLYMTVVMVGASLSMSLGGWVITALTQSHASLWGIGTPWRLTFLSVAAPAPLVVLLLCLVREPARQELRAAASGNRTSSTLNTGLIALLIVGIAAAGGVFQILLAWFPTVLIRSHGWTAGEAGSKFGLAIMAAALIASSIAIVASRRSDQESRRYRPLRVACVAVPLAAPAVILCARSDPAMSMAAAAAVSMSVLVAYCLGPVILQAVTPNRAWGRVAAFVKLSESIVIAVGVTTVGVLSDRVFPGANGISTALVTTVATVLVVSAAALLIAHTRSAQSVMDRERAATREQDVHLKWEEG